VIIRKYGEFPAISAPDIGEVVTARQSPAGEMHRAVILVAKRRRTGGLRIRVLWLEGPREGKDNSLYVRNDISGAVMLRQAPAGPGGVGVGWVRDVAPRPTRKRR
jgi:hypothetical protein